MLQGERRRGSGQQHTSHQQPSTVAVGVAAVTQRVEEGGVGRRTQLGARKRVEGEQRQRGIYGGGRKRRRRRVTRVRVGLTTNHNLLLNARKAVLLLFLLSLLFLDRVLRFSLRLLLLLSLST